jgi:3-isopropylmalate dehydrogenase
VLDAVAERFGHHFDLREHLFGGAAIDARGVPLPPDTLDACASADAVLLGAVGGPQWDDTPASERPERALLQLRKTLGLYANLRPVAVHPALSAASPLRPELLQKVDMMVVRELTGGIYFGEKTLGPASGEDGEIATDSCSYTTVEIARVVRAAATLARERRGKLTSVDKANVLETSRLWRKTTEQVVRDEFPEVMLEHMLVDACAMHLIKRPADFDVIVTENMFGDILTDEASVLAGSIGLLPSASLGGHSTADGRHRGLYEPIHGSAPDIAGRGIANPIGTILSVAMMLRHSLGLEEEADLVEHAVRATLDAGIGTGDIAPREPRSTGQVGCSILSCMH